jgi:hypothetical protein
MRLKTEDRHLKGHFRAETDLWFRGLGGMVFAIVLVTKVHKVG